MATAPRSPQLGLGEATFVFLEPTAPAAAPTPAYVQGRDYDAKIAIQRLRASVAPEEAKLAEYIKEINDIKVSSGEWLAFVRVWSEEEGELYSWTTQAVQVLAGRKFPDRIPVRDLIGGKEGTIIDFKYRNRDFRLLCSQKEKDKVNPPAQPPQDDEKNPDTFEDCIKGLKGPQNEPLNIPKILESQCPLVSKADLPAVEFDKTLDARTKSWMKALDEERKKGKTGFEFRCKGSSETVTVHLSLMKACSPLEFEKTTAYAVETQPEPLKTLIDYLYTGILPSPLTLQQCLDLIAIHKKLSISETHSSLFAHCLKSLNPQRSDLDKVLLFGQAQNVDQIVELACSKWRDELISSQDSELWLKVYQMSEKKKEEHLAIKQLNDACVELAKRYPSCLDKFIQDRSRALLHELPASDLKRLIAEAKKLNCKPLIEKYTAVLGL